jgi:hypothetical protein
MKKLSQKELLLLIPRALEQEWLTEDDGAFLRRMLKQGASPWHRADRKRLTRLVTRHAVTVAVTPLADWRKEIRDCLWCSKRFNPRRQTQNHCSESCGSASRVARMRSRNMSVVAGGREVGTPISVQPIPLRASCPPLRACAAVTFREGGDDFMWHGLDLYLGSRKVLTLAADETYPHLYRIRYPDGWTSTPANLTRAKDAAYGHARWLLSRAKAA